ncbi:hypothetical protein Bhyg_07318 [Pseudolycoriella hygida]|uniref:Uncharacterized protein n=1 Tax=Pseudolycoriella hygida TaxID=35572 RepID=A0A9Q0S3Q1_9DIPT|nr:hypothetical protein Bhyg_07318 [Pseudolycoriella hygida]
MHKTLIVSLCVLITVANATDNSLADDKYVSSSVPKSIRQKRAVVFRPLFVYRQQQIQKTRLREEREQAQAQNANYGSQEYQQPQEPQTVQKHPNSGAQAQDVHVHHHHHHHHHHYPEEQRTYESRYH